MMPDKIQLREYSKGGDLGGAPNIPQLQWQPLRPLPQLEWFAVELELQLA